MECEVNLFTIGWIGRDHPDKVIEIIKTFEKALQIPFEDYIFSQEGQVLEIIIESKHQPIFAHYRRDFDVAIQKLAVDTDWKEIDESN